MATLPEWIFEDATRQLEWMHSYRPKVEAWIPNGLAQLDKLIDGAYQIISGDIPCETAQRWLGDFVKWREVYHTRLYRYFVEHVEPTLPEPAFPQAAAANLVGQSINLMLSYQQVLGRAGSAAGTHALASLITWQQEPTWRGLMRAMDATDTAIIESETT